MRGRSTALLIAAAVLAAGGCGGDGKTYALEPTRECLSAQGVRVLWLDDEPGESDRFAARGGTLVGFGVYEVTLRFGEDAAATMSLGERRAA